MKELTKSLGNYLLAIYELVEENNAARCFPKDEYRSCVYLRSS